MGEQGREEEDWGNWPYGSPLKDQVAVPGANSQGDAGGNLLEVTSIFRPIHPFPGAILVGETYPNVKRAPVLYDEFLEKTIGRANCLILYPSAHRGATLQPAPC